MTKRSLLGILTKAQYGQPLTLRDRLCLHLWQNRQHRTYLASLGSQPPPPITGGLWRLIFKMLFSYAVAGLVLGLATPHIGLGFALLLAMLVWMLMGACWLR